MTGSALIRQALNARLAPDESALRIANLSKAERTVARLLAQGHRNREIARELGKSEFTIKRQVVSILDKLNVPNRGRAAALLLPRLERL